MLSYWLNDGWGRHSGSGCWDSLLGRSGLIARRLLLLPYSAGGSSAGHNARDVCAVFTLEAFGQRAIKTLGEPWWLAVTQGALKVLRFDLGIHGIEIAGIDARPLLGGGVITHNPGNGKEEGNNRLKVEKNQCDKDCYRNIPDCIFGSKNTLSSTQGVPSHSLLLSLGDGS